MKVLHFGRFHAPYFGGLERHVTLLLEGLKRYIHVDNLVSNDRFKSELQAMDGVRVFKVASFGLIAGTALSPTMPLWVRRLQKRNGYDIAHLHFPDPLAHAVSYVLPRSVKIVISWHSDIVRQKRWLKFYRPALDHIVNRADAIIAATPKHFTSSTQLSAVESPDKLHVVPYGIDYTRFELTSELASAAGQIRALFGDRKVIFAVGRMVYYKGFEFLLQAMEKIDAILLLGGSGPLFEQVKKAAQPFVSTGKVKLLGRIPDHELPVYYHAADVFCMPSVEPSEAFGLVQLEAMACRKPVVSCELNNGVSYVNLDGVTGLLVPPRDPSALAEAINTLLADAGTRKAMGTAGYQRATQEFSVEKMVQGTLKVYEQVIHESHERHDRSGTLLGAR